MEVTYGAALHLMMANTLFPHTTEGPDGQGYSEQAHSVFDEMVFKGNRLAAARKTELTHLEGLFQELAVRIERHGLQTLALTTPQTTEDGTEIPHLLAQHLQESAVEPGVYEHPHAHPHAHALHEDPVSSPSLPQLANSVELLDEIGISSYEFLSIIEQIGGAENNFFDSEPTREFGLE